VADFRTATRERRRSVRLIAKNYFISEFMKLVSFLRRNTEQSISLEGDQAGDFET
jgi:hypothetical protein